MPTHIAGPALLTAPGEPPKRIEEFVGRVNFEPTPSASRE